MLYQVPADLNGRGIGVKEDCIQFVKEIAEQIEGLLKGMRELGA